MRYKGKLIFEFCLEGIWLPYKDDEILWYWPWTKPYYNWGYVEDYYSLYSLNLDQKALSFKEYKKEYASSGMKAKVEGFVLTDLLHNWIKVKLRNGHFVVLYDINVSSKSTSFWTRIPSRYKKEMVKDIVVLRCKDKKEAIFLCNSIEEDFASAVAVSNADIVSINAGVEE